MAANVGMNVTSVTFDGCYANQATAALLGTDFSCLPEPKTWLQAVNICQHHCCYTVLTQFESLISDIDITMGGA